MTTAKSLPGLVAAKTVHLKGDAVLELNYVDLITPAVCAALISSATHAACLGSRVVVKRGPKPNDPDARPGTDVADFDRSTVLDNEFRKQAQ